MEKVRKFRLPVPPGPLCLICGVDSGPIRNFLIFFIGGLVLTSIAVLAWGFVTGRFKLNDEDESGSLPLRAEERID